MSSTLVEQLRAALNAARKDRDKPRTPLLSTLLSVEQYRIAREELAG